ncbi:Hypothetical protein A7982_08536 [Minicystis rosea]|nr:Hypothetical protein A7982_08536 [Minicystis rosea]
MGADESGHSGHEEPHRGANLAGSRAHRTRASRGLVVGARRCDRARGFSGRGTTLPARPFCYPARP